MSNVICFNIRGKIYDMPHSLLNSHTSALLNDKGSQQLHSVSQKEVALVGDGFQLDFFLDYLHGNGQVILPMIVWKEAFLADLIHFGILDVHTKKYTLQANLNHSIIHNCQKICLWYNQILKFQHCNCRFGTVMCLTSLPT